MNTLIYLFISGQALFVGLALSTLVLAMYRKNLNSRVRAVFVAVGFVGIVMVVASATPLPVWVFALWLAAMVSAWISLRRRPAIRWSTFAVAATLACAMTAWELRYQLPVSVDVSDRSALTVLGDSLSMGAEPPGLNWPDLLGEKLALPVTTLAFGGATTRTALSNAQRVEGGNILVILEIGGNDLLNGDDDFDEPLRRILETVCQGDRKVAMFELPLPPFFNRYGATQRRLAREFGVTLVPKRYLARVLMAPGATTDSLHLSNQGHAMLAEAAFRLMKSE